LSVESIEGKILHSASRFYEAFLNFIFYIKNKTVTNFPAKQKRLKENILFSAASLVLITFLFNLIWIFQGIDIKDTGIHVANQMMALPLNAESIRLISLTFLTDLLGGLWLRVLDYPSMIWVRMGGLMLIGLCTLLSFSVLKNYFPVKRAWQACAAAAVFIPASSLFFTINYDTLPAFLICLNIYVMHRALMAGPESSSRRLFIFLSGLVYIFMVFARTPSLVGIMAGFLVLFYALFVGVEIKKLLINSGFFIAGILTGILFFVLFLKLQGINEAYFSLLVSNLFGRSSEEMGSHSPLNLLKIYSYDFFKFVVPISIVFFGLVYLASRFAGKVGLSITLSVSAGILILVILAGQLHYANTGFLVHFSTRWVIGLILTLTGGLLFLNGRKWTDLSLISIVCVVATFLTSIGSDGALMKSNHGMWVALPLALLLAWDLKVDSQSEIIRQMAAFSSASLALVFMLGFTIRMTWQYKEIDNRFLQNIPFQFPSMDGIYSHEARTKAMDEVLFEIRKRVSPGSPIIIESGAPLLYYLSETRPALNAPYMRLIPEARRKELYAVCRTTQNPDIVVLSHINAKTENWPIKNKGDLNDTMGNTILSEVQTEVIEPLGLKRLWTNEVFDVYGR
jgi:hypothetical protein